RAMNVALNVSYLARTFGASRVHVPDRPWWAGTATGEPSRHDTEECTMTTTRTIAKAAAWSAAGLLAAATVTGVTYAGSGGSGDTTTTIAAQNTGQAESSALTGRRGGAGRKLLRQ